jgi:hypothetical protein
METTWANVRTYADLEAAILETEEPELCVCEHGYAGHWQWADSGYPCPIADASKG